MDTRRSPGVNGAFIARHEAGRMRDTFHEDLDAITRSLVDLAGLVAAAMGDATAALLDADRRLAEQVIEGDGVIDATYHAIEEQAYAVLARQQPVARDLRLLVTSLRMVADLERAGDLALHVAQVARRRFPASAIPLELRPAIREMGEVAERMMAKAGGVIASGDVARAAELETDDDRMDALHERLFAALLDGEHDGGVETAVDVTLAGRYYERFADHAVSVARRVVYLVTGERVG
jgi:phosphate transport system protein